MPHLIYYRGNHFYRKKETKIPEDTKRHPSSYDPPYVKMQETIRKDAGNDT
ncbi:MAG: hypothetical protein MJY52_00420 [Bacteroidaceae bacterium]|nr:hypothetical protein [Bacteroidaceae bacterium]